MENSANNTNAEPQASASFKMNSDGTTQVELNEVTDKITPLNFDNKAFEHEDINSRPSSSNSNPFNRDRPGSMMSIKTNASTSSRSSVNCTTGRVRCPNFRMQKFFAYKQETGFAKASQDIKALILPEKDGSFIGNWLLVEISSWDFHREKVVLLTEKTLIIVSYDFIDSKILNYKRINLSDLKKVKYGVLKYPKGSFMGDYYYGAVRLSWDEDDKIGVFQKWNPFGELPYLMFTSHHILYNEKEKETETYNCDEFISSLEYAINKLPESIKSTIEMKEEPVEIENYMNVFSALYNQNWIGFQLDSKTKFKRFDI